MEQQFEYPEGDVGGDPSEGRFGRRSLLRRGLLLAGGLGAAALVGCGDDEEDSEEPAAGGNGTATATATGTATEDGGSGEASGAGRLVQDEDLPFPYEYPDPAGEPKSGGIFRHASNFNDTTMDPTVNTTGGTLNSINPVYDRLLIYKMGPEADTTKIELEPELAASWEQTPDLLTLTFTMQDGVTWQNIDPLNGRALTAEDIAYAYNRYASEGVQQQPFAAAESIEAVDEQTLRITLREPAVDFVSGLGVRSLAIFPPELVEDGTIESRAIGSGPMILRSVESQQRVIFEKSPDHWRNVYLDGVEVRILPDANARVAAFRAEQIDHPGNTVPSVNDAQTLLETNPDIQVSMSRVTNGGFAFGMNPQHPKFVDERVRRALSLGTDREAIIQIVFGGYARAHGLIPWIFAFDEEPSGEQLGQYMHYDPDEAQSLLSAAGAEDLVINSVYYPYLTSWAQTGELLVDQWRQIGVTLNNEGIEYAAYTSQWAGGGLEEATTSGWGPPSSTIDGYTYDQLLSDSPGNRWQIRDAQLDEWCQAAHIEADPQTRRERVKQIYDRDMEMMWRIPMPGAHSIEVMQPWVRGLRFGGALGASQGVYDWADQLHHIWLDR